MRKYIFCLLFWPAIAPARSAEGPVEGVVVRVAEGEVVIDLGGDRGLIAGTDVSLYRRLVVKHPVTGKTLEDRFPIGVVRPSQVGELLSIVRETKALRRPPQVGDYAVFDPRPPAPVADKVVEVKVAPKDPQQAAIERILAENMGRPIFERIARWEGFLKAFAGSEHTEAVGRELALLRHTLKASRVVAAPSPAPEPAMLTSRGKAPSRVSVGQRAPVVVAVAEPELVEGVRLLVRRGGKPYRRVDLPKDGDYYYRGELPAEAVDTPGVLEYFVEAVRTNGTLEALVGGAGRPNRTVVEGLPAAKQPPGASEVRFTAQFVDFNTSGEADDRYFQSEGTFTYGVGYRAFTAFRVGAGVIDGTGGPTEAIDEGEPTRDLQLNYAFAEAELGLGEYVGTALRVIGGNHHSTEDGAASGVGGFEGRLRFGRADRTRLVLGGAVIGDLGAKAFTNMHIEVFPNIPLQAGVVVTNLPVNEDLGVRLTGRAGWRPVKWLSLDVIGGWNARTIKHHGYTAGGGVALNW